MKRILFIICCYSMLFLSCQPNATNQANSAKNSIGTSGVSKEKQVGAILKLTPHQIMDREGSGMIAFTCLIPEGWTVDDKLYWEYQDATLPIRYKGRFQNTKTDQTIESYPDIRAVYSEGPTGVSGYPPPQTILTGLKDFIRQQRGRINFQIKAEKIINRAQPKDQMIQGSNMHFESESGFVRISYQENNKSYEEEFYGQLDVTHSISQGYVTLRSIVWSASGLYSCKSPAGELEKCRRIALTIKASSKPTLAFYNKFIQVTQLLSDAVYQRIYAAGQISKIISQTNDAVSKSISDSYWNTQKSYDRTNQQFSDYLRGVDRYSDGQNNIQLPSGYSQAWVNEHGEYLMSETQGYNPNQELQGNWKQLDKRN
ncbi:MAG: hypothetical protein IPI45_09780 [Saprospiraceae bacterium]|nr:hypothetical protein [Saprospiraceae bacterium]MBK7738048.1 hypothetical protein [Saprospiraceae bacterium]